MRSEIQRYLEEHGAQYTPEALRRGLLDAGYDPVEVDTALGEWQSRTSEPASAENERRRFWWLALGLHAAVLVLIGILSFAIGSFAVGGWMAILILAIVLLIGLGISGAVGRGVLRGRGLPIALLVPAISALLIGGSCLALGGSFLLQQPPPPPRTGVMEIQIEPPLSFDGSGAATCQGHGTATGFSVFAEVRDTLDGRRLSVSIDVFDTRSDVTRAAPPPGAEMVSLNISLIQQSEADRPVFYTNMFNSRVEVDATSGGLSGTLLFEALEPATGEGPPGDITGLEPISGTISWSCE